MSNPGDRAIRRSRAAASLSPRTCEACLRPRGVLDPAQVARIASSLARTLALEQVPANEPDGSPPADAILFVAPEILRGDRHSQQSDVYTIGVVLYRLLTGEFPVSARMAEGGGHLDAWNARDDLRAVDSPVPMALAQIVERAVDPRPETRYATLQALCADLDEAERRLRPPEGIARYWRLHATSIAAVAAGVAMAAITWVIVRPPLPQQVAVRFDYRGASSDARAVVDGMTLEMTRLLARADGLDVYAARSLPADQRAATFSVSGSVSGDVGAWRQIEVSIIRERGSENVWSETFSLSDGDIMSVQERIGDAVVKALGVSVTTEQRRHWTTPPLQEIYLKARGLQSSATGLARQHAAEMYRHIIREAPTFVPARAALVTAEGGVSSDDPDLPALDPGVASLAQEAYDADPHLAEANAAMGLVSARRCRWDDGRAYFTRAIQHDPSATATYVDYAIAILLPAGDTREAFTAVTSGLRSDPSSLRLRRMLAHVLVEAGEYRQAIELARSLIVEAPGYQPAHQTLARALYLSERMSEAADVLRPWENQWAYRGFVLARQGHDHEARMLADAHHNEPARQMLIYAGLQDADGVVAALRRAVGANPWRAMTWMARPEIAPVLRGNAEASAIRHRLQQPGGCS